MIHFSKIQLSFLLFSFLFFSQHNFASAVELTPDPPPLTEAQCLAMQGRCADYCEDTERPPPGNCTTSAPGTPWTTSGFCCIRKDAVASTGKKIGEVQCLAKGGVCNKNCRNTDDISNGACFGGDTAGTFCCIAKGSVPILNISNKASCEQKKGVCRPQQLIRSNCNSGEVQGGACDDSPGNTICCVSSSLASTGATNTDNNGSGNNVPPPGLNYTLLEKIPGVDSKNLNFAAYLSAIYKLAIWIVGLCALFMFLVGAFMYMLSAANTSKVGSAKSIMQDALIGLVLALCSYLILYVINPDLVNLKLPTVSMSSGGAAREPGATAPKPKTAGDVYSNSEAVQELSSHGISVSSSGNCSDPTNSKCTSLENIPKSTIADIIKLKDGTKCPVTVTGGTEVGHKSHGAGLPVVDLSENSCLEQYFSKKPIGYDVAKICSDGNSQAASYNCGNFVESQAHFHVQFST